MNIDSIDLYLLHWSGGYAIEDTLAAFQRLVDQGKIVRYGVSNLDINEIQRAWEAPGGEQIATNQLLYNLQYRGIEWDMMPWCATRNLPIMAYSPINQGRISSGVLDVIAEKYKCNRFQIALAWMLEQDNIIAIPKAVNKQHIKENYEAASIKLSEGDINIIDASFPPPQQAESLSML